MSFRRLGWASVALLGLVTACGSSSGQRPAATPSPTHASSSPAAAASDGASFSSAGFSTLVPRGWQDETKQVQLVEGEQVKAAFVYRGIDGSILVAATVANSRSGRSALEAVTHERQRFAVTPIRPITLAGQRGLYVQFSERQNGTTLERDQDATFTRSGIAYIVTYGGPPHFFRTLRPAFRSVERAWRWR